MDQSLQPLLELLDRLPDEFAEVRTGITRAIRIADADPEMALTRSRKVLELVVRELYQRHLNEPPGTRPLENLIRELVKGSFFPERLDAYATAVRKLGNVGTHTFGERITMADVVRSLTHLHPILEWYFEAERPDVLLVSPGTALVVRPAQALEPSPRPRPIAGVLPKGLRAFDSHDADFFLELLPGPRDREGLPESVRFWKVRIEETDPDDSFAVGLLFGPSGCGKSSLVKAGLLPRLSKSVLTVTVDSTAGETETVLLNGLRKRCPALPTALGLQETFVALRHGECLPPDKKLLLVLDQFEQWLHARQDQENSPLVQALRQCDGGRLQCLVMVRDDFWMAATRFMEYLGYKLLVGQNSAPVDLFPARHAENVLAAFGRAYQSLPSDQDASQDQQQFVKKAVRGLAQEGKVVCVRLALFAEMMKDQPWTLTALKDVGGADGLGAAFLEKTFSAKEHQHHQQAAQGVLKALLPAHGSDIKGQVRSLDELLQASGYAGRPGRDFDDLIHILVGEMRLLTPTDPTGKGEEVSLAEARAGGKYYQLTHDYLVPALRDWLTRKQRETWRGRAELRLDQWSALWNSTPENRFLPAWWEWLNIRLFTRRRAWTELQQKMMRRATGYHALRGLGLGVAVLLVAAVAHEGYAALEARRLRNRLLEATTEEVPAVVADMAPYRRWLDAGLRDSYAEAEVSGNPRKQLHTSLALLPIDSAQVDYLVGRLLVGSPVEVAVLRKSLRSRHGELSERLWGVVQERTNDPAQRLRAACALADWVPDDPRWETVGADLAARLLAEDSLQVGDWAKALESVGRSLLRPLVGFLTEPGRGADQRRKITSLFQGFAERQSDGYAELEKVLDETPRPGASTAEKLAHDRRVSNAAAALAAMGRWDKVLPLLRPGSDPTLRSYLIEGLGTGGVAARAILAQQRGTPEASVRQALLLSLGDLDRERLPQAERIALAEPLAALYRDDPDPGIHATAWWLLRKWELREKLWEIDRVLAANKGEGKPLWSLTCQGQTMVIIPRARDFLMGEAKTRHKRRIPRGYALAAREVTVGDYLRYSKPQKPYASFAPTPDAPVIFVSWFDAAGYCNWLSEREGIPKDQWCYEPNDKGVYGPGMKVAKDYLDRVGYRLPTEAEWEYACRAGSTTPWCFGADVELLARYGWYDRHTTHRAEPVGSLRPNDWGFFDLHGSVWEWCHESVVDLKLAPGAVAIDNRPGPGVIPADTPFRLRGGSYLRPSDPTASGWRDNSPPAHENFSHAGFRVARTVR